MRCFPTKQWIHPLEIVWEAKITRHFMFEPSSSWYPLSLSAHPYVSFFHLMKFNKQLCWIYVSEISCNDHCDGSVSIQMSMYICLFSSFLAIFNIVVVNTSEMSCLSVYVCVFIWSLSRVRSMHLRQFFLSLIVRNI